MVKIFEGNKVLKNVARVVATVAVGVAGIALFDYIKKLDGLVRMAVIENYGTLLIAGSVLLAVAVSCTAMTVAVMSREDMFETDKTVETI